MSYNRQPVAEDPCRYGALLVSFLSCCYSSYGFLAGSGLRQLPDSSYLMGTGDWGPFHNYAAPRYNLLAMTGTTPPT